MVEYMDDIADEKGLVLYPVRLRYSSGFYINQEYFFDKVLFA